MLISQVAAFKAYSRVDRLTFQVVNKINAIGQAAYGPNTPDGNLFKSNWKRSSPKAAKSAPETGSDGADTAKPTEAIVKTKAASELETAASS